MMEYLFVTCLLISCDVDSRSMFVLTFCAVESSTSTSKGIVVTICPRLMSVPCQYLSSVLALTSKYRNSCRVSAF